MAPLPSAILSTVFILFGAAAIVIMMFIQGRIESENRPRLIFLHWIFGWGFVAAFLVLFGTMFGRFYSYWEEDPARLVLHYTAAFALLVLLLVKIAVPRFFPRLRVHLFFLGVSVFLFSFITVALGLSHYLVRVTQRAPYISHGSISTAPDLALGKELFIQRCRTCHLLETILQPRPTDDWEKVVDEMTQLAWPRIRPDEAKQILHYLATTRIPKAGSVGTGFTALDLHCLPCHKPDEIFSKKRTLKEWENVVGMMAEIAPEQVPDRERALIIKTLMEAQSKRAAAK